MASQILSNEELSRLYAEHNQRVLERLPPHSALPPLLDLSKPKEGSIAGKKWEDRFTGSMGVRPIDFDPGMHTEQDATSISVTVTENAGDIPLLPARSCDLVIIGKPIGASAHLAYNHRFVYSTYSVEILELLKGRNRRKLQQPTRVTAAQLGGRIRFSSGHEAAFLEGGEGFIELNNRYLLFLWKPIASSDTYIVSAAFLFENGKVFPITYYSGESRYANAQTGPFLVKVKELIAKNIDGM
jgi:hypothetical protein